MKTTDILLKSGFLHTPLKLSDYVAGDIAAQRMASEPADDVLPITGEVTVNGRGFLSEIENGYRVDTDGPLHFDSWPEEWGKYAHYCNFGSVGIRIGTDVTDWQPYTRIRFLARPVGMAIRSPHIFVHLTNTGKIPVPDRYHRVGGHQLCLEYGKWNECVWEISEIPRDQIVEIKIGMSLNGSDNTVGDAAAIEIKDLRLETSVPHINHGWECTGIAYSQSGYRLDGKKDAVTMIPCDTFRLEEKDGETKVFASKPVKFRDKMYYLLDFTSIDKAGEYRIICGDTVSAWFDICKEPFTVASLKMCNFIFCERCGYPIPGKHGICHCDIFAEHNGKTAIFNGGWHDAGDMSQQTLQTGEIITSLYHAADAAQKVDDTLLADRLYEEARWGDAFLLKTRFGDGYRVSSSGLIRHTHSFLGDMDDILARHHNNAFENLLLSAVESDAAMHENGKDRSLADQLWQAAKEDYAFGVVGLPYWNEKRPTMAEHSHASSRSLHLAAAVYAGANLLSFEKDETICKQICAFTEELLSCQETSDRYGISGFFYREADHKTPVHFNHQSREYLYAKALVLAYEIADGELKQRVYDAIVRYGEYFKKLMTYASPYGMMPAGVHLESEAEDEATFKLMHIGGRYAEQKGDILEQIQNGTPVQNGAYIRQFPVWISFRGNAAVMLSQGMACRILSDLLNDKELSDIANDQLYFMCGKNPFTQSLIYGEGDCYAPLYGCEPGQMIGATPVGLQSDNNEDVPSYPETTNATYKEVWTSPAARFMGSL